MEDDVFRWTFWLNDEDAQPNLATAADIWLSYNRVSTKILLVHRIALMILTIPDESILRPRPVQKGL